jgi:hypothetical protein
MCPGSPAWIRSRLPASLAGTHLPQRRKGVDPGCVSIAPVYPEAVRPHEGQRHRFDVRRHVVAIQEGTPTHFLDAAGAGTGQAERAGGKESPVPLVVPLDQDAVVAAVDGVRDEHGRNVRNVGNVGNVRKVARARLDSETGPSSSSLVPHVPTFLRYPAFRRSVYATRSLNRSPVSPSRRRSSARSRSCRMRSRVTPIMRPISSRVLLLPSSKPK